jgi:hypothetical protein
MDPPRHKVKTPVVLPVSAVPDGLRRVGDPAPDASAISAKHRKVLIDLFIGVFTTVAGARPVRRNS